MIIEEEDFQLIYDSEHNVFDLKMVKIIHADDPEKRREELVIFGYSMRLSGALRKIINHRIKKKQDVYTFKEYLKEYKKQLDKLDYLTNTVE